MAKTKGVFRIDFDRLGDIGDRLVEFTLFRPRHAAAGIGPLSLELTLIASAWSEKGEFDQAVADITEAVTIDPKYAFGFGQRMRRSSGRG